MATAVTAELTQFARDILTGLTDRPQRWLPSKYFYDDLGSALFEAITLLPEYGLTRADEHLLKAHAHSIVELSRYPATVVELGSGSGSKTRHIVRALDNPVYRPIDISAAALAACVNQLQDIARVQPVRGEWLSSLLEIASGRARSPMLLLFLGSSIGNFTRAEMPQFFSSLRACLRPGDSFLLGADLVKPVRTMIDAYDDPTGVTAAFNLNLLARINRELGADFDLRRFRHEARWNETSRAIEMHLVSTVAQTVHLSSIGTGVHFLPGESIWTESSHKFTLDELDHYAHQAGFTPVAHWLAHDWPFAEVLWQPA